MLNDLKNYKAPDERSKAWLYVFGVVTLIALLGFMENRDREHRAEIVAQQCNGTGA